jgi:hypothetical protein
MVMASVTERARPVVADLKERSEEELYQELALRVRGIAENPEGAGELDLAVVHDAALLGPLEDLQDLGRGFFAKFGPQAYNLVCAAEGDKDRKDIRDAFSIGPDAVGAVIAGLLVAHLAMAPAAAAVVGALVLRLFFRPAYGAMCEVWKEKLPDVRN